MTFEEWYSDNWPRLTGGRFKDGIKESWQEADKQAQECIKELLDYAQHDSWRCENRGECHCGLNTITERFGLPAIPLPEKGDTK